MMSKSLTGVSKLKTRIFYMYLIEIYTRNTISYFSEMLTHISKTTDQITGGFNKYRFRFTILAVKLSATGISNAAPSVELRKWTTIGDKSQHNTRRGNCAYATPYS
jgi:hypothetical protein